MGDLTITSTHQIDPESLSGHSDERTLCGNIIRGVGKTLVLKTWIDTGHVLNQFEVRWFVEAHQYETALVTRILERAVDKYNSL